MSLRNRVTAVGGGVAVAASVLLIGGALRWTQAVVAGLVAIAMIPQVRSRRVFDRIPALMAALGAAAALTALQLIPLTSGGLAALQPVGSALRADGAELMGTSPWPCLSLDPPATLRALAMFVTLLGVAWLSLRVCVSERGRYWVLAIVAGIGALTAAIVWLHVLFGAESLYGLYEPVQAKPRVLGPLLNENHLGGLMAICASLALGLAGYTRQRSAVRALWLVVVALCGATAVATGSRGATLALIAGLMLAVGFLAGQKLMGGADKPRSRARALTSSLPILVVAACTVIVIVYASAGEVSNQLSRTTLDEIHAPNSKFAIWRSAEELASEAPVLGIGRGAFESAISRIHPAAAVWTFSHAENEYVQALVDWGVLGAVVLGLAMAWVAVVALRRWRTGPLVAGALAALAVIALQSIVDFGLEMLGIAVPVTAILATVTYVPLEEAEPKRARIASLIRIGHVVGLLATVALLLSSVTTTNAEDHERLGDDPSPEVIKTAIERHPLDYFGYAAAAQAMLRRNEPDAVRVLNHALRLHPLHPGLHHLAARLLLRAKKPEQAAIEYAAAMRATPNPRALLAEILARLPPEIAANAIPADVPNLDDMVRLLGETTATDVKRRWLVHVLDLRPDNTQACDLLFKVVAATLDVEAAIATSDRCNRVAAHDRRVGVATMLLEKGRYEEASRAVADVETWTGSIDDRIKAWFVLCDSLAGRQLWDEAKRCLRRLDVSLLPPARRLEVTSRLDRIGEQMRVTQP